MDFYTIDFETANQNLTSACSIGIVGVTNNKIVLEETYLINPQEPFSPFNIQIHHITEEMVKNALTFDKLWEKIKDYFCQTIIFAHNAAFDFAVLRSLLNKYHLEYPTFNYGCTVKLSQLFWKKDVMVNHKLSTVANHLEIDFNHHDALEDARVCAMIVIRGLKIYNVDDVCLLYQEIKYNFGLFSEQRNYSAYKKTGRNENKEIIKTATEDFSDILEKNFILSGKTTLIKKSELKKRLLIKGGHFFGEVKEYIDYFVVLENVNIKKLREVVEMIKRGCLIQIINEKELIELLE